MFYYIVSCLSRASFGVYYSGMRVFSFAVIATIIVFIGTLLGLGWAALGTVFLLTLIEMTFSFDNAIVNARVLERMSKRWQEVFMSVGIIIAVFGMRIVFPIVLVMATAHRGFGDVVQLALHDQAQYAHLVESSKHLIEGFGGAFLMMLALNFLVDETRDVRWFDRIEKHLQKLENIWTPLAIVMVVLALSEWIIGGHEGFQVALYGVGGIATYLAIHGISALVGRTQQDSERARRATGMAGLGLFVYLEVLDASFSLDGVVGAFAITRNIILIAIGLGLGALWIRSLTLYMVERGTLHAYRYLDHGAHYTILMLAVVMFTELFWPVPEYIPGLLGVGIIGWSVWSSRRAHRRR